MISFTVANIYPVSSPVIRQAITFRQQHKMSLGDAIIAATATEYKQRLATRNTKDFAWAENIEVINPFDEQ